MLSPTYLEVLCYPESDPGDVVTQIVFLARKLGVDVCCTIDRVRVVACPDDDPVALFKAWSAASTGGACTIAPGRGVKKPLRSGS